MLRRIVDDAGVAILLVEQNLDLALQLANRGMIMEKGRIVREGTADDLRDESVLHVKEFLAI
jgi:branched-chain amino acid transport system ATP-binding protein